MTRQEQLQEQYEDALFELLMDTVLASEGEKALAESERLHGAQETEVPPELWQHSRRTIRVALGRRTFRHIRRVSWGIFRNAAIVIALGAILCTAAFAASPAFRAGSLNFMLEVFDEGVDIRFSAEGDAGVEVEQASVVGWLPEGFELEEQGINQKQEWYTYSNGQGQSIIICRYAGDFSIYSANTEEVPVQQTTVQGHEAIVSEQEKRIHIVYALDQHETLVSVVAAGVTMDDAMRVAAHLRF